MRWFILEENQKTGPFSASELSEQLKQGLVSLETLVAKEGSPVRRRILEVPEILAGGSAPAKQELTAVTELPVSLTSESPIGSNFADSPKDRTRLAHSLQEDGGKTLVRPVVEIPPSVKEQKPPKEQRPPKEQKPPKEQRPPKEQQAPKEQRPPPAAKSPVQPPAPARAPANSPEFPQANSPVNSPVNSPSRAYLTNFFAGSSALSPQFGEDLGAQVKPREPLALAPLPLPPPLPPVVPAVAAAPVSPAGPLEFGIPSAPAAPSAFKPHEPKENMPAHLRLEIDELRRQLDDLKKEKPEPIYARVEENDDKKATFRRETEGKLEVHLDRGTEGSTSKRKTSGKKGVAPGANGKNPPAWALDAEALASGGSTQQADRETKRPLLEAPPSHQLPQVASEGVLAHKNVKLNWQKNRINPTSPQQAQRIQSFLQPMLKSLRPLQRRFAAAAEKHNSLKLGNLLGVLGVALLLFVVVLAGIARRIGEIDPTVPQAANGARSGRVAPVPQPMIFDEAFVISAAPENRNARDRRSPRGSPSEDQRNGQREDQKNDQKKNQKRSQRKPDARANASEQAKSKDAKKANAQTSRGRLSQQQNMARSSAAVPKKAKVPPQKGNSAKVTAAQKRSQSLPGSWPRPVLRTGAQLASKVFKVVSVDSITLYVIPRGCAPCRVPARLSDGTSVTLVSPTDAPWKSLTARKIAVKGLVQKKPGEIWLLVQSVLASSGK